MDPYLQDLIADAEAISAPRLHAAFRFVDGVAMRMRRLHTHFDLLVTPTTPIPAFAAGTMAPDRPGVAEWFDWTPLTWPFNLTRQPAASCPNGFTRDGLPTGLQVVGRMHDDALVLRACAALEAATGPACWIGADLHPSPTG